MALVAGFLALALAAAPGDALAGGKGGKQGGRKKVPAEVQHVGVKSIDNFFVDVKDIDHRLDRAQTARHTGREGINSALGLKQGTPLADAVKELKKQAGPNLRVALNDGIPALEPMGVLPANLSGAVQAVNDACAGYVGAIDDLAGVPARTAKLVKKAQKLPVKLKNEYADGFNPLEIPDMLKGTKALKDNIKLTADLPKRTKRVVKGLNKDTKMLVETFGGTWPPTGSARGGGKAR